MVEFTQYALKGQKLLGGCVIIDYGHFWCTLLLYIV